MKKLLSLVLILALCSVAGAGLLELKIASVGPSKTETTAIDPTSEITIDPSQWLDLNIYYTGSSESPYMTLAGISVEIVVTGPGVIDLVTEHKTKTGTAGIMQLTEPAGAWDKDLRWIDVRETGVRIILDYSMSNGLAGIDEPDIALDHIMFHCENPGLVTITMSDTTDSHAMGTLEFDDDYVTSTPNFGGAVIVHQTPEPATIALLCLGGLMLRKRK